MSDQFLFLLVNTNNHFAKDQYSKLSWPFLKSRKAVQETLKWIRKQSYGNRSTYKNQKCCKTAIKIEFLAFSRKIPQSYQWNRYYVIKNSYDRCFEKIQEPNERKLSCNWINPLCEIAFMLSNFKLTLHIQSPWFSINDSYVHLCFLIEELIIWFTAHHNHWFRRKGLLRILWIDMQNSKSILDLLRLGTFA